MMSTLLESAILKRSRENRKLESDLQKLESDTKLILIKPIKETSRRLKKIKLEMALKL